MRTIAAIFCLMLAGLIAEAQPFNFYGSTYYVPTGNQVEIGTVLATDGSTLSNFNFSTSPADHPLYTTGVFYPINDCSMQNLWIRVQHIAADPNGVDVGHSISTSMNSPFLPNGSTDRIGGWNGFYYEFRIYADMQLMGKRTNTLANLHPTSITVASLETLYNDGGYLFEWLAFEILNDGASGWYLNSTNFTGINPYSTPGFSSYPYPATTGTPSSAPEGFSIDFPTGSQTIYAVDMNLSASYHSEFKMSASGVSIFRYGYEFTPGGYQGMSMEFGTPPVINPLVTPACGDVNGLIFIQATGTQPITIEWVDQQITTPIVEVSGDETYTVLATDANGCFATQDIYVPQVGPFEIGIELSGTIEDPVLTAVFISGAWPVDFSWSTGDEGDSAIPTGPGVYVLYGIDDNGCEAEEVFTIVQTTEINQKPEVQAYPNPATHGVNLQLGKNTNFIKITDASGKTVDLLKMNPTQNAQINTTNYAGGAYFFEVYFEDGSSTRGRFVVE